MTKVVFITGTSAGIGRGLATELVARGYRVFGASRHGAKGAPEGVTQLELDVRSEASVKKAVGDVLSTAGRIDVLVNNAGYMQLGPVEEVSVDEVRATFDTNYFGVIRMIQAVVPAMREQRAGRIVNVSSTGGLFATPYCAAYTATKFAMEGLTQSLRAELAQFGIEVGTVNPGFVATHMEDRQGEVPKRVAAYDGQRERVYAKFYELMGAGDPVEVIAKAVADVIGGETLARRSLVGPGSELVQQLLPLPDAHLDPIVKDFWGL